MICVEISLPYGEGWKEYVSTLQDAREYIKGLRPSQYDFSLDNVEVYRMESFDVYELMKD